MSGLMQQKLPMTRMAFIANTEQTGFIGKDKSGLRSIFIAHGAVKISVIFACQPLSAKHTWVSGTC